MVFRCDLYKLCGVQIMKERNNYDEKLDAEIEKRIAEMEEPNYVFPKRFGRRDYIAVGATVLFCLAAVIIGAYL